MEKFNALFVKGKEEQIKRRLRRDRYASSRLNDFVRKFNMDVYLQGSILIKSNTPDIDFVAVYCDMNDRDKFIRKLKDFQGKDISPVDGELIKYSVSGDVPTYTLSDYNVRFTPKGIFKSFVHPIDLSIYDQELFKKLFELKEGFNYLCD